MAKAQDDGELTFKQKAAIEMIEAGLSSGEITKRLSISRVTLADWRNTPHFAEELCRRQDAIMVTLRDMILGLGVDACNCLKDVMTNGETEAVRVRAAQIVLDKIDAWEERGTFSKKEAGPVRKAMVLQVTPDMLGREAARRAKRPEA